MFVRYAYPPNALGYCGPGDSEELLGYAATGEVDGGLRARAREFEGAWPYLELIAETAGVDDPLDPRVVRSYWLGGPAADAVALRPLADHLERRFRHKAGTSWASLTAALRPGAGPDHAFHVLAVYPWAGLMRGGVTEPGRTVIESCAIRPARIVSVAADTVEVDVPTVEWDGARLTLTSDERRTMRWRQDGLGLVGELAIGDPVAVHWDWVCDRLDEATHAELTRRLAVRLAATRF